MLWPGFEVTCLFAEFNELILASVPLFLLHLLHHINLFILRQICVVLKQGRRRFFGQLVGVLQGAGKGSDLMMISEPDQLLPSFGVILLLVLLL